MTIKDAHGRELAVLGAEAKSWRPGDDVDKLVNARIVGRAYVHVDGGGAFNALLLDTGKADELHRGHVAVFWDRYADAFRVVPLRDVSGAW